MHPEPHQGCRSMETNTDDSQAGNHERRPTNSGSTIKEKAVADTFHEVEFGKGLSGALKLLQERGSLASEGDECSEGSTVIDAKKLKEVRIERRDEFGRVMTPKEAFKDFCHKFHGKGPGKKKQEKRRRGIEREQQSKRHHFSNAASQTVERMKEAQARLKTPYLFYSKDENFKTAFSV